MAGYKLTPRAREGLLGIITYVESEFGVDVAERVLERIERAFDTIAENPEIGHVREDLTSDSNILFWAASPTLIAYRMNSPIEILIVERAEKDWGLMFS